LRIVDLERHEITATIPLGPTPDTLRLSANEKLLTVGLRGTAAQVAVLDTATLTSEIVTIGGPGTIAGHQWTSPNGHYTFAAFEGPGAGIAVLDHEQGNLVVQTLDYAGQAARRRLRPSVGEGGRGRSGAAAPAALRAARAGPARARS